MARAGQEFVTTVEIPDEMAKELSDLLLKQTIRERMMDRMTSDGDKIATEVVEDRLMPIVSRIEAIKYVITRDHIPQEYNSREYIWSYNGYAVNKNQIEIYKVDL